MISRSLISTYLAALFIFAVVNIGFSNVTVDPVGFGVTLGNAEQIESTLTLMNNFDSEIAYEIDFDIIDPEDEQMGPRRDDLGDVIGEFECHIGGGAYKNGCWDNDNDLFWVQQYSPGYICAAFDPNNDFEEVTRFRTGDLSMDLAYYDGIIYVMWIWNPILYRYDIEGNNLGNLELQGHNGINGIAVDRDEEVILAVTGAGNPHSLFSYDLEGAQIGELGDINEYVEDILFRSIEWVPEHRDGPLWVSCRNTVFQIGVDRAGGVEDWTLTETLQSFNSGNANEYGMIAHDGENIWISNHGNSTITGFDDGNMEFRNIIFDPEEGIIAANESQEITVTLLSEGILPETTTEIYVTIEFDNPDQPMLELTILLTVEDVTADLSGTVTDAATGDLVEGVTIEMDNYIMRRFSDEDGAYAYENLPPDEYVFTFSAPDYLPLMDDFRIDGEGEVQLDVELLHSQCNLDLEDIVDELDADAQSETVLTVSNDGNGPLTFTTDRRLLGDANAEPWELRAEISAGVVVEDARVHGAVFINDHFYASGANDGDAAIYVLNREQELLEQYAQLGESRYGYKDLASDGETIWGSGERIVYEFTPDGEEVSTFDCGISPCNNLAWDSDRDILWVSGTTTNIMGFDREGNQIGELDRQDLRIYGLAYWPDDPDGYQIYAYHKINDVGNLLVAKYDIANGQVMDVANLQHEIGGVAQGCFITNQYDIYSWVFMGVANSGAEDRVDIWQVDARKDWMAIEPTEGVIGAGEQQEFVVTLDATGLPQALFEGEVVFLHDGVGNETHLPLTLQVGEGGGPEEMVLELANGWNMVSAFVQPDPDDIIEIMSNLVEAGTLIMIKNGAGQFYNPQFNFNNIPGWQVEEGYMIKMDGADELTLSGDAVPWDQEILLNAGWQIASYYPRQGIDAVVVLSGIVDVLLMAKDAQGRFYSPAFGFSNMGDMVPGQGYLLKMEEAFELVYRVEEELARQASPYRLPSLLPIPQNTGVNMNLLVRMDEPMNGEVGAYSGDVLVGSGVMNDGICGLAVWGDDETTEYKDGLSEGEGFLLKFLSPNVARETELEVRNIYTGNRLVYETNSFLVSDVSQMPDIPQEFYLNLPYPNPFNNVTKIEYGLSEAGHVSMKVYDPNGRLVNTIINKEMEIGRHTIAWNAENLSSGLYLIQLETNQIKLATKVVLTK
ncbi:MAG: T9SS type A sorting domain-containing protein [Calditrichaeota bacterium]|nr:T9SS type A sorting domain-containing protein [Calditrichota bacterium]